MRLLLVQVSFLWAAARNFVLGIVCPSQVIAAIIKIKKNISGNNSSIGLNLMKSALKLRFCVLRKLNYLFNAQY